MNSFYYFLYLFSNKKHRHLVKNDALGVIYNLNVKRKIIIQFTAFVVKKNAPEGEGLNQNILFRTSSILLSYSIQWGNDIYIIAYFVLTKILSK